MKSTLYHLNSKRAEWIPFQIESTKEKASGKDVWKLSFTKTPFKENGRIWVWDKHTDEQNPYPARQMVILTFEDNNPDVLYCVVDQVSEIAEKLLQVENSQAEPEAGENASRPTP